MVGTGVVLGGGCDALHLLFLDSSWLRRGPPGHLDRDSWVRGRLETNEGSGMTANRAAAHVVWKKTITVLYLTLPSIIRSLNLYTHPAWLLYYILPLPLTYLQPSTHTNPPLSSSPLTSVNHQR